MKRSEVNQAISWARHLLAQNNIRLPVTAYWGTEEWKKNRDRIETIRRTETGWDITDFGSGDFEHTGAVLYTVRNGVQGHPEIGVPYCEKYIVMKEGQRLPCHYHVSKTEDIINRAGGVLAVFLWNTNEQGKILDSDVTVYQDGLKTVIGAGEELAVYPGSSVTLVPHMAHVFGPRKGHGPVICGEVSKVNDDHTDNFFLETIARFSAIEEDEPALLPLCTEYGSI